MFVLNLVLVWLLGLFVFSEVMKGLWAKKQAKMKKNMVDSADWEKGKTGLEIMDNAARRSEAEDKQVKKKSHLKDLSFLKSSRIGIV